MKKTNGKAEVTALEKLVKAATSLPADEKAKAQWPQIWECLNPVWINGKCTRQAGRLSIRLSGPWFVVTIACPTEGVQLSAMSNTLFDLLDVLELKLGTPGVEWEPDWESMKKTRQVRIDPLDSR